MDDNMEVEDFASRWYDKSEGDMVTHKIQAVVSEYSQTGWSQYKEPTIIQDAQGRSQVTIHLHRERKNTRAR